MSLADGMAWEKEFGVWNEKTEEVSEIEYYKLLRKEKKVSLQEIADHVGLSKVSISHYENGKTKNFSKVQEYRKYIERKWMNINKNGWTTK